MDLLRLEGPLLPSYGQVWVLTHGSTHLVWNLKNPQNLSPNPQTPPYVLRVPHLVWFFIGWKEKLQSNSPLTTGLDTPYSTPSSGKVTEWLKTKRESCMAENVTGFERSKGSKTKEWLR